MDGVLVSDGGVQYRDPNAERDADHYGPGTGGKKRKTPAFVQYGGRQEGVMSNSSDDEDFATIDAVRYFPACRPLRSRAATACAFRKALFLRRKAALITLYIDAQNVISSGAVKPGVQGAPGLMDIPAFEELIPSLEDIPTGDWPPDQPDWRSKWEGEQPLLKARTLEQWKTGFDRRHRQVTSYKPTARGGWAPEGSFEFDMPSKASNAVRLKTKHRTMLHKLIVDLRSLALSAKPQPPPSVGSLDKPPQKAQRIAAARRPEPQSLQTTTPMSRSPSKESDLPSIKGKSKKKKKKRSVLANQGNPHHVDNYRPSRKANPPINPYEPYPHHEFLLFPPPMRLLSTVPQRRTAPMPGQSVTVGQVRAAEDDFICCFCEMDLFFGSEAARKRAIRRLKEERRRKETIRTKAKDVAEGKGKLRDEESEYDDDDEDWCGEDDGHGRCTCGRQISEPHRSVKSRLKPPETDPPPDLSDQHHVHDHVGNAPLHQDHALSLDAGNYTPSQSDEVVNNSGEGVFLHEDLD